MLKLNKQVDGQIGEAFCGEAPNGSHINVVVATKGSETYSAAIRSLASPSPGHVPFLACLGLGNVVRPATIVLNKITIENERYEKIFYGAAQLGIAQGVMDAVREGLIDQEKIDEMGILVACWIDPDAQDETKVRLNTRDAMFRSLKNALEPVSQQYVQKLLSIYETATNNYYSGE
jgi:5,6,7,8-tetrahydromethanopterin hydro-lyase